MPVHDELEKITKDGEASNADAQHYFDILDDIEKEDAEAPTTTWCSAACSSWRSPTGPEEHQRLDPRGRSTRWTARPSRRTSSSYSDLSKELGEGLKNERQQIINRAGLIAKAKLEHELQSQGPAQPGPAHPVRDHDQGEGAHRVLAHGRRKQEGLGTVQDKRRIADEEEVALRGRVLARRAGHVRVHAHQELQGLPHQQDRRLRQRRQ